MGKTREGITFFVGQKRIAILWFTLSALLFITVFALGMSNLYKEDSKQLWDWLLPNIIPTLSLIIGVFVAEVSNEQRKNKEINKFYFRLTFYMSLFYLLILLTLLLIDPFQIHLRTTERIENTDTFLIPLQGLIAATLGLFFVKSN